MQLFPKKQLSYISAYITNQMSLFQQIFQLPNFTLVESLSLISEPILATHFVDVSVTVSRLNFLTHLFQSFLAVSNGFTEISLVDTLNFQKITWTWPASIHWIKCCPVALRSKTTVVTFDVTGAICLWLAGRKTPIRQILIVRFDVVLRIRELFLLPKHAWSRRMCHNQSKNSTKTIKVSLNNTERITED